MVFHVLTLFPELFSAFKKESIIGRALKAKKAKIQLVNIRDFSTDRHQKVDDSPYGGGDGMLGTCEPIFRAFESIRGVADNFQFSIFNFQKEKIRRKKAKIRHIFLSPGGKRLTQRGLERLAKYDQIVLLSGRYEGVDQRVIDALIDEEISIGDYVLTGGELPAMVVMDGVIRLLPGVLGKEGSHEQDSFSKAFGGKKEYPHYTKPAEFRGMKVPDVLLSGNHAEIEKWRREHLR
ncbi:MAG: tRNA (guanosine(37)-N1)-methyltransferase TrmD [Candidatus Altimarinota bacterium]